MNSHVHRLVERPLVQCSSSNNGENSILNRSHQCPLSSSCTNTLLHPQPLPFSISKNSKGGPGRLEEAMFETEKHVAFAGNVAEFYPILARFDLQGLKKKSLILVKKLFAVWEHSIQQRREKISTLGAQERRDFLDVMLAKGFTDHQINNLIPELMSAGTDTSTATVEWAMAELVKNKEAMRKVLKREIKQDSFNESDLPRLPYLLACVTETLRLHPPVQFLVPHRALETCQVMGYTRVLVNVYGIGPDPAAWEDPLCFKPERFVEAENKVGFQGMDFELILYGCEASDVDFGSLGALL